MIASAHTHTIYSDGNQEHLEILTLAEELKITDVVFADHDLLIPDEVLPGLQHYTGPVRWHSGIELTTFYSTSPGAKGGTLHLLGLGVDRSNEQLRAYCDVLQSERAKTMHGTVLHLRALGFEISEEAVRAKAGKGSLVSPHVVQALELDTNAHNRLIHNDLLAKLEAAAARGNKKAQHLKALRDGDGEKQEPYILYMKNYSFRPANASNRSSMLPLEESCNLIRAAGGKVVLAHWFFNASALPFEQLETLVARGLFDGLEIDIVNEISKLDISADTKRLRELATRHDLPTLASSDSHSREDLELFARSPRSDGTTEQLRAFL